MAGSVSGYTNLPDRSFGRQKYPNPFLDLSRVYMPKGVKSILKFCRTFFYKNEFINSVLHKMTEYPITPLIFEKVKDPDLQRKWQEILYHDLKIKTFLIEVGLDYHVFGNCFISAVQKFKRQLQCPHCEELTDANSFNPKNLKYERHKYRGNCPKCHTENVEFKISDLPLEDTSSLKFVRWAPELIDIEYDSYSGEREYFYTLDSATKRAIIAGRIEKINKMPQIFLESVEKSRKIKIDPNNFFHLKRPDIAEEDMSWGKPTILPALSLIWYMQTLRRGNEAVALEHVVPMRAIYPASTGEVSPLLNLNMSTWKGRMQDEITNYRNDPNHIAIFPIPIGYQSLGGDARALLTTPELKFLEESIINSLGVPIEFVKGGTTWTGSSISLRIVENGFLSYREHLEDLLNYFVIPKVSGLVKLQQIKVKFKRLRMADDTDTKNLAMQLNGTGKLPDSMLLEDLGYDPIEAMRTMGDDIETKGQLDKKRAAFETAVQSILTEGQMRGQAKGEAAYIEEKSLIDEEMFNEEIASEAGNLLGNLDTSAFMRKLTAQLIGLAPEQQSLYLSKMYPKMPTVASLLAKRLQLSNEFMLQSTPNTTQLQQSREEQEMKNIVSQRRARSGGAKPKSSATKHTGQKRGTP